MKRSLIGYQGSKYILLNQLLPLFPKNIDTFYDLFGGSGSVTINTKANKLIYNDINSDLSNLFNHIKNTSLQQIQEEIYQKGKVLTKIPFNELRDGFNSKRNDSILFLILLKRSFSCLVRYNKNGKYNATEGKERFQNLNKIFEDLYRFKKNIDNLNIEFNSKDFRDFKSFKENDFVYLDPPYFLTPSGYTRFLDKTFEDDFYTYLEFLLENKIKFGLSNLLQNDKGDRYKRLEDFIEKYNLNYKILTHKYSRNNATKIVGDFKEEEVYVYNYELEDKQDKIGLFKLI